MNVYTPSRIMVGESLRKPRRCSEYLVEGALKEKHDVY